MSVSRIMQQAAAGAAGGAATYVDDVFSTYLYDGTGSAQTITNGIDLAGEGGLVWTKGRDYVSYHILHDTERGKTQYFLLPDTSGSQTDSSGFLISSFNNDGYSLGTAGSVNTSGRDYASWTFRKQPGFFDVVTYTGTGSAQNISHSLGSAPGMIIVKRTDDASVWGVFHRSLGATKKITLNETTASETRSDYWNDTEPTDSQFTVGTSTQVNRSGGTYVAYLFAHDDSDESIIKCGSYTTDGNEDATIDLGFEPQWLLVKRTDSNLASDWRIIDSMRGWEADGDAAYVEPNTTDAEAQTGDGRYYLTSTGFKQDNFGANRDYIYMAIRRPHKPAEEFAATDLFAVELASNTSAGGKIFTTTFPVDFTIQKQHTVSSNFFVNDRMRDGGNNTAYIQTNTTNAEANFASVTMEFDHMDGVYSTTSFNWSPRIFYALRRAPGFFDVVTYEGNGVNGHQIDHNLGVEPELIIQKVRSIAGSDWHTWAAGPGSQVDSGGITGLALDLNSAGYTTINYGANLNMLNAKPTSSYINVKNVSWDSNGSNASGQDYVVYLFATAPGISKVGTYTGTGSNVDVDCGFTSGARFVLVKRTDSTGDWYLWDSERGIVAGNDPYLFLNTTAAQVTSTDYIDPLSSGFTITSSAPAALNASGGNYIFYAIA